MEFSIMTCNIGNERARSEQVVGGLRESGADLIGLQEVSHGQAEALQAALRDIYPYQVVFPGGFAGKAVFSRYPVLNAQQLQLSTVRPDLMASVKLGNRTLTLIVAHPPPPLLSWRGFYFDPQTWGQIQALARLARENRPAVLLGDFNLVDQSSEYAYLRAAGLQDAFAASRGKPGYTLPKRIGPWKRLIWLNRMLRWLPLPPVARVDYIFHTSEISSLDARVGEDLGSDHLPVLAKLRLN